MAVASPFINDAREPSGQRPALKVETSWKRLRHAQSSAQTIEGGTGGEAATIAASRALGQRGRTRGDASPYPRRRILNLNLDHTCVAADNPIICVKPLS
jgi:hypothetical protein